MKREAFIHFAFLISFFIFISLVKKWFSLPYWPFWVGGLIGTLLPDLDHAIYALYLRPQDLSSQRVSYMLQKRNIWATIKFLEETRRERTRLIFHSASFELIFLILTFWVISSSGSVFGQGIVLSFLLHLIIDQATDITETGGLTNWFRTFVIWTPTEKRQAWIWWGGGVFLLLIFGFLL